MAKRTNVVLRASPGALAERLNLKQAAIRDRDLDLEIAGDWFAVDREQWQKLENQAGSDYPERHFQPLQRRDHGRPSCRGFRPSR